MAMYKYILNKINKYHQEITVDDKFWTYLKADEVQDELDDLEEYEQIIVEQYLKYVQDDLEEVLEKLSNHSIWWREEMSWEDLIKELGAEGYWGDSFDKLEDYLDYDKLADALIDDGFIECDFGFLEIAGKEIIMREVVQKVYKFEELEKKVQEEVLERYRYTWVNSLDWGEYTSEDFTVIMFYEHRFNVDKDSVSFSMDDAEAGAGFTGEFETAQAAINVAKNFDTKGFIKESVLDEIRKYGKVRVSKYSWVSSNPRSWNTYIELLIDGIPMEEDEKYAAFVDALESWRKEECERLYENAQDDYEYYTCDNYIRTELAEGNYEFLADGTDF